MIKRQNPPRHLAQQRPSRIRREPPAPPPPPKSLRISSSEEETWTVVVGVILFSLAIGIIVIAVGNYIGR